MRTLILSVMLCCATFHHGLAAAGDSPTILIVGDSLSAGYGLRIGEGWVDLLTDRLRAQGYEYRVVNASISGDTTSGGRARLARALSRHDPAILVIELGGNDGLRGLPIAIIRGNLDAMIDMAEADGARVILLGMRIPSNYGRRYAEDFDALYGTLAGERGLPWVEFFLDGVAQDPSLMQADRVHPNAAAQGALLDNAWEALAPLLLARDTNEAISAVPDGTE